MLLAHDPVAGPDGLDDVGHRHVVGLLAVLEQPVQVLQRLLGVKKASERGGVSTEEKGCKKGICKYPVKLQLTDGLCVPECLCKTRFKTRQQSIRLSRRRGD